MCIRKFLACGLSAFRYTRLFAPSAAMNNNKGLDALAIPYIDVFTNIAQSQLTVKEVLEKIETDFC